MKNNKKVKQKQCFILLQIKKKVNENHTVPVSSYKLTVWRFLLTVCLFVG